MVYVLPDSSCPGGRYPNPRGSRRGPSPAPEQREEVVPGTDQCSLALDRGKPAEEELPEAPGALEETEGGLREDLPPGVQGVAACRQNDPVFRNPERILPCCRYP